MKDKLFKYSKDRSFTVNLILSIFSFIGILIIPSLIYIGLSYFVKNALVANIIADVIFILILYLIYYKDLNEEFKIYNGKFKENFKYSFKIYLMGFMGMVFFNLIISMFLKNISSNESQVREMLYASPVFTMLTISIIAPVTEELVFRKSLQPVIKNKWIRLALYVLGFICSAIVVATIAVESIKFAAFPGFSMDKAYEQSANITSNIEGELEILQNKAQKENVI